MSGPVGQLVPRPAMMRHTRMVLEMSKGLFNGRDYLPNVYPHWVYRQAKKKERVNYVFEDTQGRAFGFQSYFIQNNGQFALRQGGRLHKEARGNGVFYQISKENEMELRKKYPDIAFYRSLYTGNSCEKYDKSGEEVCRRGAIYISIPQNQLAHCKNAKRSEKENKIDTLSFEDMQRHFKKGRLDYALQNDILRFDLHSIHRSTIPNLHEVHPFDIKSFSDNSPNPESFSMSSPAFPGCKGLVGYIDIFSQSNFDKARQHLDKHLKSLTCADLPCQSDIPLLLAIHVDPEITEQMRNYVKEEVDKAKFFNVSHKRKIEEEGDHFAITYRVA